MNLALLIAILLGISTIVYSFIGVILQIALPIFIPTLMIIGSLSLQGYSISRYQALVERRTLWRDLPTSFVMTSALITIYLIAASWVQLSIAATSILIVLIITTHALSAWLSEYFYRRISNRDLSLQRDIRHMSRQDAGSFAIDRTLRKGLAILCHNLQASSGFIATEESRHFVVKSSLHSLPSDTIIAFEEALTESLTKPEGSLKSKAVWLAPGYGGTQQLILVGIGERKGLREYSEGDLDWVQDIADELGAMVFTYRQQLDESADDEQLADQLFAIDDRSRPQTDALFSALAHKPDPDLVANVEDSLRHLNDYIKLGKSPLVEQLDVGGETHIERGKAVQQTIIKTLETLRPVGEQPKEPLPREWYSYSILHDAYVEGIPTREIMMKLYISEGTFYRTRRKAIIGVTRALVEMGVVAVQQP